MTLDQAIQTTIFKCGKRTLTDLNDLSRNDREATIQHFKQLYLWTRSECEEYLDNIELAYDLLIKEAS